MLVHGHTDSDKNSTALIPDTKPGRLGADSDGAMSGPELTVSSNVGVMGNAETL